MNKRKGLGRVSVPFLKTIKSIKKNPTTPNESIIAVPLDKITASQPRTHFDTEALQELANNIREQGLLEPILVKNIKTRIKLLPERRFRAHQILAETSIKARVYEQLTDRKMMEWALIENTQREQLSSIEEANAYGKLIEEYQYTHEKLAHTMGKSRTTITNTLRLKKLPEIVQDWVHEGKLTMSHARALLSPEIKDPIAEAERIINLGASVRQIEKKTQKQKPKSTSKDPNLVHFEGELRYKLYRDNINQKKTAQVF